MRGKQRYRCKACGLNFTDTPPRGKPLQMKVTAVLLYVSGLSMNRTAKLLGVSTPTVMAWIEQFAKVYAQKPEPEGRAVVIELDEMWHYLKKSRTSSGSGRLGIVLQGGWLTGNAAVVTGYPRAAARAREALEPALYCADDWAAYAELIPQAGGSMSARTRPTASSATMPASGTGWPASAAARSWSPSALLPVSAT